MKSRFEEGLNGMKSNHLSRKYLIRLEDVLNVFDEWVSRGHYIFWKNDVSEVRNNFIKNSNIHGIMDLNEFVWTIESAKTPKMHGQANKGLEYIKQECKKMRFEHEEN